LTRFYFIVLFLASFQILQAQKDSLRLTPGISNPPKQKIILSAQQDQWLKKNYARLNKLPKQKATAEIKKNFAGVSESSIEFFISEAARLTKGDQQKEILQLEQMLQTLKTQKNVLAKKITEKEGELNKTFDASKRTSISNEIQNLKIQIEKNDEAIANTENRIKQLRQ